MKIIKPSFVIERFNANDVLRGIDIVPHFKEKWKDDKTSAAQLWVDILEHAEQNYQHMIKLGVPPELARSVLPNSLKTEIVITANLREWRHIFKLRTNKRVHPQMRQIMIPLLQEMKQKLPVIFDDITEEE